MIHTKVVRNIHLRLATAADANTLLKWVNSPDSLRWKRETKRAIAADEHQSWLAKRFADPDTALWIIESDKQAIGQVRLQRDGEAFAIDIYVDASHRKAGLAAAAIDNAVSKFRQRGEADIVADVHKDNTPSRGLFERLGFVLADERGDWLRYRLPAENPVKATRP